eukprot:GILJ01022506.1.p2 GENE.GILJ01022506.1~~GILJ01022506.1.p2  ORF type:complete len:106 (-),score=12.25 GILJ01022506.1:55-372(-)
MTARVCVDEARLFFFKWGLDSFRMAVLLDTALLRKVPVGALFGHCGRIADALDFTHTSGFSRTLSNESASSEQGRETEPLVSASSTSLPLVTSNSMEAVSPSETT